MAQFKKARIDKASSSTPQTAASERCQPCGSNWVSSSLCKLYEPKPPQINSIDIIFFHGLQFEHNSDAYLSTWRSGDASQEVWPQTWLPEKYPEARIISVSYDASVGTSDTKGRMDMHLIGENLIAEILGLRKKQGKECPIILVGHSFGGLVVKQICIQAYKRKDTSGNGQDIRKFLDSVRGIFFYATPHLGINPAVMWKDSVLSSMPANKPLLSFVETLGKEAARLHGEFDQLWRDYEWRLYGVGELHPMEGQSNLFVEEASSRFGDEYTTVGSDHFSICRPASKTCTRYQRLVDLIDVIYDQKSKDERRNHEHIFKNVMGLEPLVAEIHELLKEHTFLGFCGMGGVGKTTIAKVVFDILSPTFENTCFVYDVKLLGNREEIKKKIWENMRHRKSRSVPTTADDVRGKKLLIVLDDIDEWEHVKLLQEMAADNASEDSRFITTSRDGEVLKQLKGNYVYNVQTLEPQVARKLFIAHAFPGQRGPLEGLEPYVEKVVKGCEGLPLTLEVLGTYLRGQTDVRIWDEIVDSLRNAEAHPSSLEERVWRKLKVSYNTLGDPEKHMFLDIASFLLLEDCPFSLQDFKTAWSSMFSSVHIRWKTLVDRSLIPEESTTYLSSGDVRPVIQSSGSNSRMGYGDEDKIVRMHEHLRSMGQKIAKETGRYFSMTDSHCGGNSIQPEKIVALSAHISLHSDGDVDGSCDNSCSPCKVQKFFSQLKGVRYLDLDNRPSLPCERCRTSGGFSLPRGLVMFEWRGSNVNVQVPLEAAVCTSLAVLRLERDDDCSLDILSPLTLGSLSSLKRLELLQCAKLKGLPETVGNLSSLERLELKGCSGLGRLPESFGNLGRSLKHLQIDRCEKLEGLPETFGNLSSLERLELQWCSGLERLPESFGNLGRSLKHLEIYYCISLKGLPETFGNLSSLERLELLWCSGLERLPESFGNLGRSLKHLQISICEELEGLPETFGNLSSLEHLGLQLCSGLERLPESFENLGRSLKHLRISFCRKLEGLPETFGNLSSLERLELWRCDRLERLPESFGNLGRSLKHLEIAWCRKLERLPETFGNLSSLERLELQGCSGLERLPESFGNLGRSLKHLQIIHCIKLEGLPETFGNLSRLERLELKSCDLLERLPESFGNLGRSLKHLEIVACPKLEVPGTIRNWSSLKLLDIN